MLRILLSFIIIALSTQWLTPSAIAAESSSSSRTKGYTGTQTCRECHETFYQPWSSSRHAKAMQPFTRAFVQSQLAPQSKAVVIGKHRYRADLANGAIVESGPEGEAVYPISYAMGGKNVFYFLTAMERGRLQTLPVAYDVNEKKWFDTAKSGVRHFPGAESDEPVHWTDRPYTFNTSCYNCHVSQLNTNYDLKTDTYQTTWAEPGINCETCHGPCDEHIRVCRQAPEGTIPKDLRTIRGGRSFTAAQNNHACSTCHAKAAPLTEGFMPGDSFFDHFDLVTLESVDYYPDGRDLGENYTLTSWLLSPCVKSGALHCLHCHTSSGRYRHKNNPNQSCMPCHKEVVKEATDHTRHKADSPGNRCIACHMPMTSFAKMNRSDHSMLPPTPQGTIRFQSPNACNDCHNDKDAVWADAWVRKWRKRDYQKPLMQRAVLIDAARKKDWTRLPDMLAYIEAKKREEVFAASLIRLLRACPDQAVWPVFMKAAEDGSPLVRSCAVESLGRIPSKEAIDTLLAATRDDVRLVRIKAAAALAAYSRFALKEADRESLNRATEEYFATIKARPDHWTSHYNLGNFFLKRSDLPSALSAYETALKLEPRAVMPMINAAMAYARAEQNNEADIYLRKALDISPGNAVAHYNMGLLQAELKHLNDAEEHLRAALEADPQMHQAAFNLGILLAKDRPGESIDILSKAFDLHPNPKYAYTLAFYLHQNKDVDRAIRTLDVIIENWADYADAYLLLADIRERQGKRAEAIRVLNDALNRQSIPERDRFRIIEEVIDLQTAQ